MIIESMSRKAVSFSQLLEYVNKETEKEREPILHNFRSRGDDLQKISGEFESNYQYCPERVNGVVLYHEILSFSKEDGKFVTEEMLHDFGRKYIEKRAREALVYAKAHFDQANPHIHFIISGNLLESSKKLRLSKSHFFRIKKELEQYQLEKYPFLDKSIADREERERRGLSTKREQGYKSREGQERERRLSREEEIKDEFIDCLEADTPNEFIDLLQNAGLKGYARGNTLGLFLNRNYGQHAAIMAGFAHCRGQIVVTLDADLQNQPEDIPKLIAAIGEGHDIVGTIRVPRQDNLFRRVASHITNKMVQKTTGVLLHDYGCMLRAYRRHIVKAMLDCPERSTFIPVLANNFSSRVTEIPVSHRQRSTGESKYGLLKLINLQFDLLTSMTTFPLRMLSVVGGLVSLAGMGLGVLIILLRLKYGSQWAAEGVFTLFAILFVFIGAQFFGMGLMGEYIGRIYYDVRARPRYTIQTIVQKADGTGTVDFSLPHNQEKRE